MTQKHFVFILHTPVKDKCLMYPGYYEDHKKDIDKEYEEVLNHDISKQIGFHAFLAKEQPYKVFTRKQRQKK